MSRVEHTDEGCMRLVVASEDCLREEAIGLCGLKAHASAHLVAEGLGTPTFNVLTTAAHRIAREVGLGALGQAMAELRLGLGPMERIVVRSSAIVRSAGAVHYEDGSGINMAGWFRSEINIGTASLERAVRRCYAAGESPKIQALLNAAAVCANAEVAIALIVQRYLSADLSAVLYTQDPFRQGGEREMLLAASYGPCGALVSGVETGDTAWLSISGKLNRVKRSKKRTMYVEARRDGLRRERVPFADRDRFCLGESDVAAIHALGMRIEAIFGVPQNIELVRHNYRWIPIQTRACITRGITG
jgi:rifampicin phosphotransferase